MKKISVFTALILVISMIFCLAVPLGAVTASGEENTKKAEYEMLLNRIGVSAKYDENAYITRGDFTVLAVQALGVEPFGGETEFTDVSGEQEKYINTALGLGLLSMNSEKLFYPDRIIKAEEASAICLRMLGYGNVITGADAYPAGYLSWASRLKLSDKIALGANLTGADAAKMLFNTLDTNYLKEDYSAKENNRYVLSNSTYLYEIFGVRKQRGIITSVYGTSLNGYSPAEKNEMAIDSVCYENPYYDGFGYYSYLGKHVEYYVKDTKTGAEVVYIKDLSEMCDIDFMDVTEVRGFDVSDSVSDRRMPKLFFSEPSGKKGEAKIKADATILINGEKRLKITNGDFKLPSGRVTLVDNDTDGIYDVVCVEQHAYHRLAYFDKTTGKIETDKGEILFCINDVEEENMIFLAGDKEVGSEILVEDAVIQLMCSYKDDGTVDTEKNIAVSVKTQIVEGTIEYIDEDGYLGINGTDYRVLPEIKEELSGRIGKKTSFYLGNDKLIVSYKEFDDTSALIYGYLVATGDDGNFKTKNMVRIFSENEEMEVYSLSENVKFTGYYNGKFVVNRSLKEKEVLDIIKPKQLIRYNINQDGEIVLIEQAYDYSEEKGYKGFDKNRFSLDFASNSAFIYQRYVGNNYKSNANTVYFYVDSKSTDEEDFSCSHYIDRGHRIDGAKVKVYDSDEILQPTVVVIEDYPQSSVRMQDNCGSFTVVTKKRMSENADGDWTTTFDTYQGNTFRAGSDDIKPLNKSHYDIPTTITNISQIKNGDIIKFSARKDGDIDRFIMISEYDKTHTDSSWGAYANDFEEYDHMSEISYVKGRIISFVPKSHLVVECNENQRFCFTRSSLTYIEYNVTEDSVTYSSALPRLTVGDYVWFQASRGDISTLVRYVTE